MAQYLMALLGHRDPSMMFGGLPENGRMGDYVFNQEGKLSSQIHVIGSHNILQLLMK